MSGHRKYTTKPTSYLQIIFNELNMKDYVYYYLINFVFAVSVERMSHAKTEVCIMYT